MRSGTSPNPRIRPRDYQSASIQAVLSALRTHRSCLVDLPTGTGKTVVFMLLIEMAIRHKRRVLVLVHRDELVQQTVDRLRRDMNIIADIEKGARKAETWSPVVVASVQTLGKAPRAKMIEGVSVMDCRLYRWAQDAFDLVVVDECHHALAPSWRFVLDYFHKSKQVGVTATAERLDGGDLSKVFEKVAYRMPMGDAINLGWLVPIWQQYIHVAGLDFTNVRKVGNELSADDIEKQCLHVDNLERMAFPTVDQLQGRKAVVFNTKVNDASVFAELVRKCGIEAEMVHGNRKVMGVRRRREIIAAFKRGDIQVLCNVDVLTEGFDDPEIGLVAQCRWTTSRAVYAQQVGRGTRPLPGVVDGYDTPEARKAAIAASDKPYLRVLDFVGVGSELDLESSPSAIFGDTVDDEVLMKAKEIVRSNGGGDIKEAIEIAQKLVDEARSREHKKLAYQIEDMDPFWRTEPGQVMKLLGLNRELTLVKDRPTPGQVEQLRRLGMDKASSLSRVEAAAVLDRLHDRKRVGKARIRQVRCLVRYGMEPANALQLSFEDARSRIDELQRNDWRRPASWDRSSTRTSSPVSASA